MPRTASKAKSKPKFSERLNRLLDWAGYAERGRASTLAKRLSQSRVVTRSWLKNDIVPVNLDKVVELILDDCSSYASVSSTVKWLLTADESKNPMDAMTLQKFRNIDYQLLSKVFICVHNVALAKKIDIEKIPNSHMDLIYSTILKQISRSSKTELNETVIADLLDSARNIV